MTVANTVDQYTILTGDRVKIKDLICSRLAECGWRDEVRLMCRNVLTEKGTGTEANLTAEQLINEVTPRARAMVPDAVKKELLMKIKAILAEKIAEMEEPNGEVEDE